MNIRIRKRKEFISDGLIVKEWNHNHQHDPPTSQRKEIKIPSTIAGIVEGHCNQHDRSTPPRIMQLEAMIARP
jgi:hypothetical protein